MYPEDGYLYSSPGPKWSFGKADHIAIEIYSAWPVQDDSESWVGLYVPGNWDRKLFLDKLKAKVPPGFEHVSQYPEGKFSDETPVFKYVPYDSYVGAKGLFDSAGFIEAFREATKTLVGMVGMEKVIDGILESLG